MQAGSVKLDWRTLDECFLSDQVEVPQGLHVCQLVVDGDAISTHDFTVSDTSRTIDVLISQGKIPQTSNIECSYIALEYLQIYGNHVIHFVVKV